MNAFDPALFAADIGCLPCCNQPGECACALLIPPFGSPYADYATAAAVVADPFAVADCIAHLTNNSDIPTAYSATDSGTAIVLSATYASPVGAFGENWLSITLSSGDTVQVAFTGGTQIQVVVYDCTGTELESLFDTTTVTTSAVSADGVYYLKIIVSIPIMGTPFSSATATVTPSSTYVTNPVIALWDDSGTTRQLEACPKLYLPILTESTGTWYANSTEAAAVLASALVSGSCLGYDDVGDISFLSSFSFSATGGSSLSFSHSATGDSGVGPPGTYKPMSACGSFNAVAGDVITVAWSVSGPDGTGEQGTCQIYDEEGTSIFSDSNTTGANFVSSALPYTGRFTVVIGADYLIASDLFGSITCAATVSSSGTMTTNPIQALFDEGLECPGRLDCT